MNAAHPTLVGQPIDRRDGRAKVTGQARYAAEFPAESLAHVALVLSTIARGRIRRLDTDAARRAPGVLGVFTRANTPPWHQPPEDSEGKLGEKQLPLTSDEIHYDGEIIALVAATSLEAAQEAARLVAADYDAATPIVDLEAATEFREPATFMGRLKLQFTRGEPDAAFGRDDVVAVDAVYETPFMHHHPIEPHASLARWQGDQLTVYTSTQSVVGTRELTAAVLGLPKEKVRIVSPFLGGGFGCKGFVWAHPFLAAMVARELGRPARLVHTRQQMFTVNGHRPRTLQRVALAAGRDGRLVGIRHEVRTHTSTVDEFIPAIANVSSILYASPAAAIRHRVAPLNLGTGTPARAPGEAPGTFALESAMDELARALGMDPVELRHRNLSPANPQDGHPWSANRVDQCYRRGAEIFGWDTRPASPGQRRDGRLLIGQGMATATYPAHRAKASVIGQWHADDKIVFASATQDIGTGTYTIMAQVAADVLGVPVEQIEFRLGDTAFPGAPGSGGSRTAASVAPAVRAAAVRLREQLIATVVADPQSPLHGTGPDRVELRGGRFISRGTDRASESVAQVLRRRNLPLVEARATALTAAEAAGKEPGEKPAAVPAPAVPDPERNDDEEKYSFHSFGAHFVEVAVDPDLGQARVRRVVSAIDVGTVMNFKTARSQVIGAAIMGIGMALMESTACDPRDGRIVTRNLADCLVPVNADAPSIEVVFIDEPDPHFNEIGCRGLGEIGITGITAAVANAIYDATGRRLRRLPITVDQLVAVTT